ncbi:MAG TPA: T9SS type A sorting domain-containing protein, partial [Chitinophagales bacterium]|nr:T9SS type A sorting domain-containing protein [Chitinophagales bacterium]
LMPFSLVNPNSMPLKMSKTTSPKKLACKDSKFYVKRIIVCMILLLTNSLIAQNTGKIIKVASPGNDNDIQPAIQKAVNNAVKGDIIELPAGQFIVNKSVVVTKFISIKGAGMDKTILYRSESVSDATLGTSLSWKAIFRFNINSTAKSGIVISDIGLKSKKPSLVDGDGLSVAEDVGIEMINCKDFVITRCKFEYFGNGGVSVTHDDSIVGGLICKNVFSHNVKGYDGLGLGYGVVIYGANKKWLNNPRFGSSNFIFVEDNTFDYHRHSIAAGGCALYVFRYNTVKNNTAASASHAIDAHEARLVKGGNYYSTRAIEVYNNSIINTKFKDGTGKVANGTLIVPGKSVDLLTECAIRTRGGEAMIHDNYIEGYRFGVGLVTPEETSYPFSFQQGYLSGLKYGVNHKGVDGDKASGDVFIWSDKFKFYNTKSSQNVYFHNYTPDLIKEERDYHMFSGPDYTSYIYPHPLNSITVSVDDTQDNGMMNSFNIYPNPASEGVIHIGTENQSAASLGVEMINLAGVVVKKTELTTGAASLNVRDLPNGVYLIRIVLSTQENYIHKVVIVN